MRRPGAVAPDKKPDDGHRPSSSAFILPGDTRRPVQGNRDVVPVWAFCLSAFSSHVTCHRPRRRSSPKGNVSLRSSSCAGALALRPQRDAVPVGGDAKRESGRSTPLAIGRRAASRCSLPLFSPRGAEPLFCSSVGPFAGESRPVPPFPHRAGSPAGRPGRGRGVFSSRGRPVLLSLHANCCWGCHR